MYVFVPQTQWLARYEFIMMILSLFAIVYAWSSRGDVLTTRVGPNGHLMWIVHEQVQEQEYFTPVFTSLWGCIYGSGLFFPLLLLPELNTIVFGTTLAIYLTAKHQSSIGEVPSQWCYIAIVVACVPYLAYLFPM